MKRVSVCVLAAAMAVLWVGVARAERPGMFAAASAAKAKRMSPEQREERRFLKDAAAAGRFESEASRMAMSKSNNPGVRSFAATLINHHAATGTELQHMLHGRGMAPPMLANEQRKILNRLARLHGTKFDREYMEEVGLKHQQEDVHSYEQASLVTRDPALKAWIARNLPTLRYQLATAERITTPAADTKLAKGGNIRRAGMAQPAHQATPQSAAQSRFGSRAERPTQFMGAGPMQLGTTQPVAARPIGSNSR